MRLEALEFLERVEKWVAVIEPDHEADRHLAIFKMIEKRAAIGRGVERPANRVHDEPRLVAVRSDLP